MTEAKKMGNAVATTDAPKPRLTGTYSEGSAITARLQAAARKFNLVTPFTDVGMLPPGCAVCMSMVHIDPDAETYSIPGGKRGLTKGALDRIAMALGLSWDPAQSRRLDDGRDPHYCHYKAVGHYRGVDGQFKSVIGDKEMDMREGSEQLGKPGDVKMKRAHIVSHAETKARLRAIRSMGIRTAYYPRELERPFVMAQLVFTGQMGDPELDRQVAMMTAASFLGANNALYGGAHQPVPALEAQVPETYAAPPVEEVEDDSGPIDATVLDPEPERRAQTRRSSGAGQNAVMRFGHNKGTTFAAATDRDLEWYGEALAGSIADPDKERFRASNERDLAELRAVQAEREETGEVVDAQDESEFSDDDDFPGGW